MSTITVVRFLRAFGPYNAGERAGFEPERAKELVQAGVASLDGPVPAPQGRVRRSREN